METLTLDWWTATCLRDTPLWLDGGAFFGPTPKTQWSKETAPDAQNRICVGLNCLLLRGLGRSILFDAGIGDRYSDAVAAEMNLDRSQTLWKSMGAAGVEPEEIDTIVLSHLHFDHIGGLMRRNQHKEGKLLPAFPNATVVVQQAEWDAAHHTNELTRDWYSPDELEMLHALKLVRLVEGEAEIAPGVRVLPTGAHSPGHQAMAVHTHAGCLFCAGDLIPAATHLRLDRVSAWDESPCHVVDAKREILRAAETDNWLLFLSHELKNPLGKLGKQPNNDVICSFFVENPETSGNYGGK